MNNNDSNDNSDQNNPQRQHGNNNYDTTNNKTKRKEVKVWGDKKYQVPDIALLPTSALSLIERSIFDSTSAFLSDENHMTKENVGVIYFIYVNVYVCIHNLTFITKYF